MSPRINLKMARIADSGPSPVSYAALTDESRNSTPFDSSRLPSSRPVSPQLLRLPDQTTGAGHAPARFKLGKLNAIEPSETFKPPEVFMPASERPSTLAALGDVQFRVEASVVKALSDVLIRDESSNPVFESGPQNKLPIPTSDWYGTVQQGFLHMSDGSKMVAYRNATDKLDYDTNCHGYSMADGKFVVVDPDMQDWLENTPHMGKVDDPQQGDLVIYRNTDGKIVHSAISTGDGMVLMAAGSIVYDNHIQSTPLGGVAGISKATRVPVEEGWWPIEEASIEYWRPAGSKLGDETKPIE